MPAKTSKYIHIPIVFIVEEENEIFKVQISAQSFLNYDMEELTLELRVSCNSI